jgi:hypothetical protein
MVFVIVCIINTHLTSTTLTAYYAYTYTYTQLNEEYRETNRAHNATIIDLDAKLKACKSKIKHVQYGM